MVYDVDQYFHCVATKMGLCARVYKNNGKSTVL